MKKPRVAVDMDEVIADALQAERNWLSSEFGYEWNDDELVGVRLKDLVSSEHALALEKYLHKGAFFGNLQPIEGSQTALREMAKHYDVFITTAAMEYPASLPHKWAWLAENFSFLNPLNFVFCGDKSIIRADFLIDDNVRHFDRFAGQGIVFSSHHNLLETQFPRLENWNDAQSLLSDLASHTPGAYAQPRS
ncbi:5' nucleotidase, NT5C type (plasmid) [Agrobacterium sp. rho-13.3]|uniref:5' nucleotidase, NT5C type n=1 Tax=Agrobacterium sp. rho-13.3 TaxID=3072980 RepID=UPI002A0B3021|nr:hypothetical protein [Agrobacterium sp. rho-13.3]MDX8310171.1 hypothetical protein [Agrobacterium sp. rho-13.3]